MRSRASPVFDALVVGAGPAGCAAAIRMAARGLRVALIERAKFPRDVPGEALHPDVDRLFGELGLTKAIAKAGFVRYPGWIQDRSGVRTLIPFGEQSGLRFGYQAWRSELDSILLAHARRKGVTVLQPASRGELVLAGARVTGLQVDGNLWYCRCLVDASGATRWLSRNLGLHVQDFSPKLVAWYAYFREECALGAIPEFHEHACGWTWLARVREDCCQSVQLSLAPGAGRPVGAPTVRLRGADVTWRFVPQCAGEGYFLCGDAAAVLDPAAAGGVARALASGLKAADLIVQVAKNQMDSFGAAAVYRQWCAQQFIQQARQLAARYAELEEPPGWLDSLERHFAHLEELQSNSLANAGNSTITSF